MIHRQLLLPEPLPKPKPLPPQPQDDNKIKIQIQVQQLLPVFNPQLLPPQLLPQPLSHAQEEPHPVSRPQPQLLQISLIRNLHRLITLYSMWIFGK